MDRPTTRRSPDRFPRRAARGAALLFVLAATACTDELDRRFGSEKRLRIDGCLLVITSPGYKGRYPILEPIPVRVEISNPSDAPQVFDFRARRRGDCNYGGYTPVPAQREPVELLLVGHAGAIGAELEPFVWRAPAAATFGPRITLQAGETVVLFDTTFVPPKHFAAVKGNLCLRAWNVEADTGIGTRHPRY